MELVTVNGLPIAYTVTGGGEYCDGGMGVEVGLSDSEADVMYGLWLDGAPLMPAIQGTGFPISFGYMTTEGTYTVEAEKLNTLCVNNMVGSVDVITNPVPVVNAGPDVAILTGTTTTLDGTVTDGTPGYTYEWMPGGDNNRRYCCWPNR